jgi:hypothetical protein
LKNVVKHLMPGEIERIRLLGHDQDLAYRLDGDALIVAMPTEFATEPAYVLKVSRRDILGT